MYVCVFSVFDLDSSYWFTSEPLESTTLQNMLTRILAIREVHHEQELSKDQSSTSADDHSWMWNRPVLIHILPKVLWSDAIAHSLITTMK